MSASDTPSICRHGSLARSCAICDEIEESTFVLRERLAATENALSLVMNYPDIRVYIGSVLSEIADAAIDAARS